MPATHLKFTYEHLLHYPPDGKRHELADGEHFVQATPVPRHQTLVGRFAFHLTTATRATGRDLVMIGPLDVVLSDFDVVSPDIMLFAQKNRDRVLETHVAGPPDLVVEVLSPSTRKFDEITKRNLYKRFGVGEYWIVDPELELIKVYRLHGDAFAPKVELTAEAGDRLTTDLVPGFDVALVDLFG